MLRNERQALKKEKNAEKQEKLRYGSCHCTTRESTKEGNFKSCKYQPSNVAGPRAGFSGTESFGSTGSASRVSPKGEEEFTKRKPWKNSSDKKIKGRD